MRVGIGYDVHRFRDGNAVTLGGVRIPYHRGLEGHSDADVLLHALMDAVLGAGGLPDIGVLFPDTDPAYLGASSVDLAAVVRQQIGQKGLRVTQVDCVLVAEEPKISPYRAQMRSAIASAFGLEEGSVGLKATTNEGLGFVGRGEGICAFAVALLTDA
ncbi:MAG: 2-C-methyl-D-erythritol 2,4-cyclodiphosphate synthase [Bacillota bacterium]|jgi:2-C-methyl-D-erythritol 2,4-cyclodiphosphate synthase|nr:2-C-methyl-D-erythritol 2,4-cyclodiphosphate synthase [Bacillota bacterium]